MVVDGTIDTKRDALEPPEGSEDDEDTETKDDLFCAVRKPARGEDKVVDHMREHQDGEVQSWKLYGTSQVISSGGFKTMVELT